MKLTKSWLARLAAVALSLPVAACGGGGDGPLRLYVLDCGNIEILDISVFQPGIGVGEHKNLAVSCYLVTHPTQGSILFDAGVGDEMVGRQVPVQGIAIFTAAKSLASQLHAIGHTPDSVTYLALSHFHPDHTGNVKLFPKATLLVQQEEFDAGFGPNPAQYGYDPALYATLAANPTRTLQGDLDVFGDGSVTIKRALGHTPGHQAMLVNLPKRGYVYLSGDAVHYSENWVRKTVPSFNFDAVKSLETMQDIDRLLLAKDAVLWIGHDLEQNAGIAHAPAFHE